MCLIGKIITISTVCAAVLLLVPSVDAQVAFRPGTEPAQFPHAGNARAGDAVRTSREFIATLGVSAETYPPLADVRRILDEVTGTDTLQDGFLTSAWQQLQDIAGAIDAAVEACQPSDLDRHIQALRSLGRRTQRNGQSIASFRDQLLDLYRDDVSTYNWRIVRMQNTTKDNSLAGARFEGSDLASTARLLTEHSRSGAEANSAAAVRRIVLAPLAVVRTVQNSLDTDDFSYAAYIALRRLPHILEKHEMIVYLGELAIRYVQLVDTINEVLTGVAEDYEKRCRCPPNLQTSLEPFERIFAGDAVTLQQLEQRREAAVRERNTRLREETDRRLREVRGALERHRIARELATESRRAENYDVARMQEAFAAFQQRHRQFTERQRLRQQGREYDSLRRQRDDDIRRRERGR